MSAANYLHSYLNSTRKAITKICKYTPYGANIQPHGAIFPPRGANLPTNGGNFQPDGATIPPSGGNNLTGDGGLPPYGANLPPRGGNLSIVTNPPNTGVSISKTHFLTLKS